MTSEDEERYLAMAEVEREKDVRTTLRDHIYCCWHQLVGLAATAGAYISPNFEDETVNVVVRHMGGWQHLCRTLCPWDRAGRLRTCFRRLYHEVLKHGAKQKEKGHLPGIHEQNNGYDPKYVIPVLTGKRPSS